MRSKLAESIYNIIKKNPGLKQKDIADTLGVNRHKVSNALPSLDSNGLLVYEDEDSRLYPFED